MKTEALSWLVSCKPLAFEHSGFENKLEAQHWIDTFIRDTEVNSIHYNIVDGIEWNIKSNDLNWRFGSFVRKEDAEHFLRIMKANLEVQALWRTTDE